MAESRPEERADPASPTRPTEPIAPPARRRISERRCRRLGPHPATARAHAEDRSLPPVPQARRGRHGRGLGGGARCARSAPRGAEAHQGQRREPDGALRGRARALALMQHPASRDLRCRHGTDGRPYFAMELVEGVPLTLYCDAQRLDLEARLRLFQKVCRRRPACASQGHHPPRSQTVERAGHRAGRDAQPEGHRLRGRQGGRASAHRRHTDQRLGRDACLRQSRADASQRRRHRRRHPQRRLFALDDALRAPGGRVAVRGLESPARIDLRAPAPPQRGGAAAPQRAPCRAPRSRRACGGSTHRRCGVAAPPHRRSRLDRRQGPRARSGKALRIGRRPVRRSRPAPPRRARGRRAAERDLSPAQARHSPPGRGRVSGGLRGPVIGFAATMAVQARRIAGERDAPPAKRRRPRRSPSFCSRPSARPIRGRAAAT